MTADWMVSALGLAAIVWTLLPLIRHEVWWIRIFDFPRVQVTVLSVAVMIIYASVSGWHEPEDIVVLTALGVCIALQLMRIAPYTTLYPTQVKAAHGAGHENIVAVLVANVLTPNRNADALLEKIRECDPDVVLTVETDEWWQSRLDALDVDYPHSVKYPLDNLYGMHLYSRLELIEPQVLFLVEKTIPSIHATLRLRSGHRVGLHCLHPAPPSPTESPTAAPRDAELLVLAKHLDAEQQTVVVMGDLNDVAWSATTRLFRNLSGLLDPRIGRGTFSTFHAKYPFLRWPLDHVFCSADFTLVSLRRLGFFGSDHFPILATLCHTPAARQVHETPRGSDHEQSWAEKKIEQVGADEDAARAVVEGERDERPTQG